MGLRSRLRAANAAPLAVAVAGLFAALALVRTATAGEVNGLVDRAVVRFIAPELGGYRAPRYIFERELSFEARIQALADPERPRDSTKPYDSRHVRSALERHIAESLLANLRVDPVATEAEIAQQSDSARRMLYDRVGGEASLLAAASADGMTEREITNMLRRQARASIYLDRMVAPMLTPTRAELRQVYSAERHPFVQQTFEEAEVGLKQWWVGHRLADAVEQFFANARQRVSIRLLVVADQVQVGPRQK